ncbi:7128_t:CDS:2 [Acaulospora morrowiae]|uniref:7128_t:CDS:1 n=1 Tax=Acaulospora morrowiae TaxID=94023 RepID=A0A9N9A817_9GLOM|nr:7128_t:CDS:2 [Acaulospora morrowiae]
MTSAQKPKRVAIIGSGVSGLGASWLLAEHSPHVVTLYEQNDYIGGHTHTVDYVLPGTKNSANPISVPVDTGFIVYNPHTYPNLIKFFCHKQIESIKTNMSFSLSRNHGEFEWAGKNLFSVFAQPSNLWNIDMWQTLYDIFRFNFHATELLELDNEHPEKKMSLGEYLEIHQYSKAFKDNYLVPMTAAIWSTPPDKCSLDFPVSTLIQFMHNHSMLQIIDQAQWLTVKDGSRKYVESVTPHIKDIRLSTKVVSITRRPSDPDDPNSPPLITITDQKGRRDEFDHVIFATHADQALKILGDEATEEEKLVLGNIKFAKNRAVLHSDTSLMPARRLTHAAWNYITTSTGSSQNTNQISLTYSMNILQSIDESIYGPVLVTLNPLWEPDPAKTFDSWIYEHPQYSAATIASQKSLPSIQNLPHLATTFAGAWTKYGFHEDGFTSGLKVATEFLGAECPFEIIDATYIRGRKSELTSVQKLQKMLWSGVEWSVNNSKPLAVIGITIASVYMQHAYKIIQNHGSGSDVNQSNEPSGTPSPSATPTKTPDSGDNQKPLIIAVGVSVGIIGLIAIGTLIFCLTKRRRNKSEVEVLRIPSDNVEH